MTTQEQIKKACRDLEEALMNEYRISQHELESKVLKIRCHNDTLIARDAVRDINFY